MKLFKNRTVLGIFCIAVSLIICFAITPLVNAGLSKKVTIVRFNRQVNEREEITRSMLDEVEVGNHNLPENVIRYCRCGRKISDHYCVCRGLYSYR